MKSRGIKYILKGFLCTMLFQTFGLKAQLERVQTEIFTDKDWVNSTYSTGSLGFVLTGYKNRKFRIAMLDTLLRVKYEWDFPIPAGASVTDIEFLPTTSHFIILEKQLGKKYVINRFNLLTGSMDRLPLQGFKDCSFNDDFVFIQDKIWIVGDKKKYQFIYLFNLHTLALEKIIPLSEKPNRAHKISYMGNDEVSIGFYKFEEGITKFEIMLLDLDGNVLSNGLFATSKQAFRRNIYQATAVRVNESEIVLTGTFTEGSSRQCGMFFCEWDDGEIDDYIYYYFDSMDHFYDFLQPDYDPLDYPDRWREDKSNAGVGNLINIHQTVFTDDRIIFYMECYRYAFNGANEFSGYRYTNGYLVSFNTSGEVITDVGFRIMQTYLPLSVIDYTKLEHDGDKCRIFNCGKKTIMVVNLEKDEIDINTLDADLKYDDEMNEKDADDGIEFWYGQYVFMIHYRIRLDPENRWKLPMDIIITKAKLEE